MRQLWLFWVAPIVGALLAGVAYPALAGEVRGEDVPQEGLAPMPR